MLILGISYQNLGGDQIFAELNKVIIDEENYNNSTITFQNLSSLGEFIEFSELEYNNLSKIPDEIIKKYANFKMVFFEIQRKDETLMKIEIK